MPASPWHDPSAGPFAKLRGDLRAASPCEGGVWCSPPSQGGPGESGLDDLPKSSLPQGERTAIISYGIAIRLSDLRKRLFLAESKVKHCEGKYQTTLAELDAEGLPDDADWEMHEDYILWRHWAEVIGKTREALVSFCKLSASQTCWAKGGQTAFF